ncbi:uncharacterized protein LOC112453038 [Temnothorax curvispinosus]|uniref:Uncharacterized protein LOC112453038 n=1 Tax=Temnothorax curvispinosus TaxID=300111 RepID=A0A6J1PJ73_9HYME|nr:uncharacterized protein LOC112453038 [Temnothorax curvispinosus]
MTSHCDSNLAQYERNRKFGHLVHALGRAAGDAKLPSVGLCLNASKAVSSLVKGGNDISRSLLIWRRVTGEGPKEKRKFVETITESVLGRIVPIRRVREAAGTDWKGTIFMELEEVDDKEELIRRNDEIWRRWEVGVDELLTMEERVYRHKLVKKAREERQKGRSVILTNRRLWIDAKEVKWDEERGT